VAGAVSTDPHSAVKNDDVVPRRVVGIDSVRVVLYACYFFYRKVEVPVHNYARRFFKTVKSRGLLVSDGARASGPRARGVSSDAAA
jgi:hypothetical protein